MSPSSRVIVAEVLAFAGVCMWLLVSQRHRQLAGIRMPTDAKLLRPPGESLSRELAKLDDKLGIYMAVVLVGPGFLAFVTQSLPIQAFLVLLIPVIAICSMPLLNVAKLRRDYLLGYFGERAVGETLNQLLREGCHVFHDYPAGDNWNIDHIIVAPSGVYAVETKARRKRRAGKDQPGHEFIFDGDRLQFPDGSDIRALEQARRNAKDLSRQLTSATGEPVKVKPILTYPGWYVTRKGKGDVNVLNPKEIRSAVLNQKDPQLGTAQIQRIVHQLEQKCRDVEL